MKGLTLTWGLWAHIAAPLATLLITLAGLVLMFRQSRLATVLLFDAIAVLLLPEFAPSLKGQFSTVPTWVLLSLGILSALLVLRAVLALFFGRTTAEATISGLLVRIFDLALRTVFRVIGAPFRALLRR